MTDSIADKERRLSALAETLLPEIAERLRRGDAALEIAQSLDEEGPDDRDLDVDLKTLYRWVVFVEERLEKKRRRVGILAAALIWVGFLSFGAGVLGATTALSVPAPLVVGSGGGVITIAGLVVWKVGKRRACVHASELIG